ncbi:hypothetical protein OUZ56_022919 [Daphnia magna]|uniref:Secreted protein n=1 Tax=Daphnia magna TaxID=35525 RepID=A0ABR0AXY4_9CRUS|nr:hypothetical protein OUZ56_022919 [Daphnia magna]
MAGYSVCRQGVSVPLSTWFGLACFSSLAVEKFLSKNWTVSSSFRIKIFVHQTVHEICGQKSSSGAVCSSQNRQLVQHFKFVAGLMRCAGCRSDAEGSIGFL